MYITTFWRRNILGASWFLHCDNVCKAVIAICTVGRIKTDDLLLNLIHVSDLCNQWENNAYNQTAPHKEGTLG